MNERRPEAGSPTATPSRAVAGPSDEQLIGGLAVGRLEALETLYDRYASMAYAIARRVTRDDVLAEDVVQEAFLAAWRSADRYASGKGTVRAWLLSIVHHRAIDAVRRRRPASDLPTEESGPVPAALALPDLWGEVSARLDRDTVAVAMEALPEAQRETIELAYFGGLTQTEIAERTGVPLGTVKSRVRLALTTLRRELEAAGHGDGRSGGTR